MQNMWCDMEENKEITKLKQQVGVLEVTIIKLCRDFQELKQRAQSAIRDAEDQWKMAHDLCEELKKLKGDCTCKQKP